MTAKTLRWLLALLVLGLSLSTILAGQITVDVKLVTFVATVTDSAGRHIPNLKPADFIVEEDGIPQTVTLVEQSNDAGEYGRVPTPVPVWNPRSIRRHHRRPFPADLGAEDHIF